MRIEQVSEHVWSCRLWIAIPIHVWLVKDEEGVTLVDTGIGLMVTGIRKTLDLLNAGPIDRIVLTHGHSDHTGGLNRLLQYVKAPVYAHRIEIPYMQGDIPYERRKPKKLVEKGIVQPLAENEHGHLQPIGGLQPYLTPGHSPGHVAYYHEKDKVLLAGDLFSSRKGQLRVGMFTPDIQTSVRSSSIISQLQPVSVECCHGESIPYPAEQLDRYTSQYLI